jgi:transposase, IS30 family
MRSYRRITLEDRCQISGYLKSDLSLAEISKRLGFHRSSLVREVRRHSLCKTYCPQMAQEQAGLRYRQCRRKMKLQGAILIQVEQLLRNDWSPEQISGRLRKEQGLVLSHETIYKRVRAYKGYFRPHLRRLKRLRGAGRYRQKGRHKNSFQPNISQRPRAAENRSRLGHWERDIMFAANKTPILVCADRKSRYLKISLVKNLKAHTVNDKTNELLSSLKFSAQTVTSDRGTEFKVPLKSIKTFYCDPQAPYQRGTVENSIGLIRQYISLKTDPIEITPRRLQEIEHKINNRPRKTLDYKTPLEVVTKQNVALVT